MRQFYEQKNLIEGSKPENGWESEEAKQKAITDDKHGFIRTVLSQLYIFNCMDAAEFNLTIRSLANFFKTHKSIGMVVLDGLHFIENMEYLNQQEKKAMSDSMKDKVTTNIQTMAEEMGEDVPNMDDFFGGEEKKDQTEQISSTNQKKSMILPTRVKRSNQLDPKIFD